tara:strand:+ start:12806 stop:13699 length:894 start_codon:yes stop_codon:yes gene_type:complete
MELLKRLRRMVKKEVNKRLFCLVIAIALVIPITFAQSIQVGLINQDPDPVNAGDVVEIKFKIENYWETTRDDVIIEIFPEFPFTIYSGSTKRNIGTLEGRQISTDSVIVDYLLRVDKNAVDGDHEINIAVNVGDTYWKYDDMFYVDVKKEKLNLKTYIRSSDLVIAGSKGSVSLELANAGGYDIEFLELTLLPSTDYKLLSTSNYAYIGDLDSDDTESEEFSIYVSEGISEVKIPIKLIYEINDYTYEEEETLNLKMLTSEEAENIGLIKISYARYIWLGLLIGIILLFMFKKLKKQ